MTVLVALFISLGSYAQNHNNHQHVGTIFENAPAANNGQCTSWVLDDSTTCVLVDGDRTKKWRRSCDHVWDDEGFCWNGNPNSLQNVCTSWYLDGGTECFDGTLQWVRACSDVRYSGRICSNSNPN